MFIVEGKRWWTRPALLAYWGLLAVISVAGWSRQLVRARRHRRYDPPPQPSRAERNAQITPASQTEHPAPTHGPHGHGNGSGFAQMMDAADQRLPTFSVNARRKFFHALAVVMFVPGIAVDVRYVNFPFIVLKLNDIASIHPPIIQRSIRILQFRRIRPVLCPLAFWRFSSSIPERIPRFQGLWNGYFITFLPTGRMRESIMVGRSSGCSGLYWSSGSWNR